MTSVFSPGHVTCFFQPVRTDSVMTTGSRGVGFKLSLGTKVIVEERTDDKIITMLDGTESECPITKDVIRNLAPGRGFDVTFDNDLPVGQGFGMSASGALASAIAVSEIVGKTTDDAYRTAHCSEVSLHGGLGDVAAITCRSHVPLREIPGTDGRTVDTGLRTELNLIVLGDTLSTRSVLTDRRKSLLIENKGKELIDEFSKKPNMGDLFRYSREFSSATGLETFEISSFLSLVGESGMCMLGHSVFTTAPEDEIVDLLGDVIMYHCETTDELPKVIRKA